jgi:L,D-peptidoglycan transpeptidase YkuD (ErfK/YbiS/YcfS/YnhG family)
MNWTDGCIAIENADVDEIYSVLSLGTPVTILP